MNRKKILAAVLLSLTASFVARGQCAFTASQDGSDLRLFKLTPPAGQIVRFGAVAPGGSYGVFWKTATGTETPMQVVSWSDQEIRARVPDAVRVCAGAYTIVLRLPRNVTLGRLADCTFPLPVVLTSATAPSGADPACGTVAACVLTASTATAHPGDWVALNTLPPGSIRAGDRVTLTCVATGRQTTLTVTQNNSQLGITLPAQGLDCPGGQYTIQSGQCQGVINVLPAVLPAADCGTVQGAAAAYFRLGVAGNATPGSAVTATLLDNRSRALPEGGVPLPGGVGSVTISSVSWSVSEDPAGATLLTPGSDYVVRSSDNRQAVMSLAPQLVEGLRGRPLPSVRRYMRATLTLTGGVLGTGATCTLTVSYPFNLVAVPVPRVLALFRRANFDTGAGLGADAGAPNKRAVMVMVWPDDNDHTGAPLNSLRALNAELTWLGSVLPSPGSSFPTNSPLANLAAFALGLRGLNSSLSAAAGDTSYTQFFLAGKEVSSLRDIHMNPGGHPYAEDLFDSLMYLGTPGTGAAFFNNQKFTPDQGAFELKLKPNAYFASLSDLRFKDDATAAPFLNSAAAATVTVTTPPGGPKYALLGNEIWGNDFCCHQAASFGAEISSLRLTP